MHRQPTLKNGKGGYGLVCKGTHRQVRQGFARRQPAQPAAVRQSNECICGLRNGVLFCGMQFFCKGESARMGLAEDVWSEIIY